MPTLFELTHEQQDLKARLEAIEDVLEEAGGVVTDEESRAYDALVDDLAASEADIESKLDGYGFVKAEIEAEIGEIEGRMEPLREILDNLRARCDAKKRQVERLKQAVLDYLENTGLERIDCDHFRFRRQRNGGKQPLAFSAEADPYDARFDAFVRKDFDNDALRQALDAGDERAAEVARLEPRGHHLRVS